MGLTALLLCLLPVLTPATQELVRLNVSPSVTAECGKQVTVSCHASSSHINLSVKLMEWYFNKTSLCSVDSEGDITVHHRHALGDFDCEYQDGKLSLNIQKVQPMQRGNYFCKLQSNMGVKHQYTAVELQECSGTAEGSETSDGLSCTFSHVYPDGDVQWFQGSDRLFGTPSHPTTTKSVAEGGWLTIQSHLKSPRSDVSYNCTLISITSGRHLASAVVQSPKKARTGNLSTNGVGSPGPMWTVLCVSILLALTLK
ncbi:uncharacterized protein V6R79_004365 [Siganus canaliculatus]